MLNCALTFAALFSSYHIVPTVIGRTFSIGMRKRFAQANCLFLTFDDGPHPVYTAALLDLLRRHGAQATFFVVGELAERQPALLQRMVAEGHSIGIHHYHHRSAWRMTPRGVRAEVERCARAIASATGREPQLYRPPWGRFNAGSWRAAGGRAIVMWSFIFGDWKAEASRRALRRKLNRTFPPGSILLLHDNGDTKGADADAPAVMLAELDRFLARERARGTRFAAIR